MSTGAVDTLALPRRKQDAEERPRYGEHSTRERPVIRSELTFAMLATGATSSFISLLAGGRERGEKRVS